jgi:hypothetical protein
MNINLWVRPLGSALAITSDLYAEMPDITPDQGVWANDWCIFVGTIIDADGETHLQISGAEFSTELPLVFDGFIDSPSGRVCVTDAHLTEFGEVSVNGQTSRIRVWANHPREPTHVLVTIQ